MTKKKITDQLEAILEDKEVMALDEFIEKAKGIANKVSHRYDEFSIAIERGKINTACIISGVRDETDNEGKERGEKEEAELKRSQEAELKEWLRLNKIYGKGYRICFCIYCL